MGLALLIDDHWHRLTPVTLAGKDPVSKTIADDPGADLPLLEPFDAPCDRLILVEAIQEAAIYVWAFPDPGLLADISAGDHLDDRQFEASGKIPVALIMPRHTHDGAGSVSHQDVVCDPDRHRLPGTGIHRMRTDEDPALAGICT